MSSVRPLYQDPFSPVLLSSEVLAVSPEQKMYVKKVLDRACSDSRFSDKAYAAITQILTGGSVKVPTVTALSPTSVTLGSPNFDVHVFGTNFTPESKIIFAGQEEPTTFVSPTEVKTGVNMAVWLGPDSVPVGVQSKEGVMSNTMNFTFTNPVVLTASKSQSAIKPEPTKPVLVSHPSAESDPIVVKSTDVKK